MKTWQFIVLIATILVAAYVHGGLYQIAAVQGNGEQQPTTAFKINRFTGEMWDMRPYLNSDGNVEYEQRRVQ